MKSRILTLAVFALTVAAAYALTADACPKGKYHGWGGGCPEGPCCEGKFTGEPGMGPGPCDAMHFMEGLGFIIRMAEDLDLSAQQRGEIKKMREDVKSKVKPLREKIMKLKEEIIDELKKEKFDWSLVTAKHKEITQAKTKIMDLHFNMALQIYGKLTPDQREKIWSELDSRYPDIGG